MLDTTFTNSCGRQHSVTQCLCGVRATPGCHPATQPEHLLRRPYIQSDHAPDCASKHAPAYPVFWVFTFKEKDFGSHLRSFLVHPQCCPNLLTLIITPLRVSKSLPRHSVAGLPRTGLGRSGATSSTSLYLQHQKAQRSTAHRSTAQHSVTH